jgi:hypothetical protein
MARVLGTIGAVLVAFVAISGTVEARNAQHETAYETPCETLAMQNIEHPDLDMILNYSGCNATFDADGHLTGFARGDSACERKAHEGTFRYDLTGPKFHWYMADTDYAGIQCVMYEDWSWGIE